MFERKKCRDCGEPLKDAWEFCPMCGAEAGRRKAPSPSDIFGSIDKEFERVDKAMGMSIFGLPGMDMSKARGKGISITIRNVPGKPPQIELNTSGGYRKAEPELRQMLGVGQAAGRGVKEALRRGIRTPRTTEEPEMKVEKAGKRQTISIELPGVKNRKDVEVRKLEQSLEVKAFAGDKAYFKLIPIAPSSQISDMEFDEGLLKIEINL